MALVATLIANPSNPVLTPSLGEAASDAVNASGLYWLADGIACDIALRDGTDPDAALKTLKDIIGDAAVDVAVQAAETRRKKLLLADMDSTMIGQECIDELADFLGVKAQVAEITERAMRGELDFTGALDERVALLEGLEETAIEQCLAQRISPTRGAGTVIATLSAQGARCVLVTGGFHRFADPIAERLGFDRVVGNRLLIEDGKLSGKVQKPIYIYY